jgi:chemotaxis protein MotB
MAKDCPKCDEGLPPWLATFADLMSLLMCFFVLLLSFAEVDAQRFKKMAEAMKDAFGVQREVPVMDVVMGTSVIKQEFSPSTISEPSPIDEIRQQTTETEKEHLDVPDKEKSEGEETNELNVKMEQLQQKLEDMEKLVADQKDQLEQAVDPEQIAKLEKAIQELQAELEKTKQELQAKIDKLLEKIEAMETVIEQQREALEQATDPEKVAELEKAMQDLKEELEKITTDQQPELDESEQERLELEAQRRLQAEIKQQTDELKGILKDEIADGLVTVEAVKDKIIIRIQEKGSFSSGSADFNPGFLDVIDRISDAIVRSPGRVVVAGHTDNVPIYTNRFRSNWELSSARAVTVVHALLMNPGVSEDRVLIEGHADSHPLVPNDNAENRAKNRRVELILVRGEEGKKRDAIGVGQ